MLIYILLALACIISSIKPKEKWAVFSLLLFAFVITAFRGERIGVDTIKYMHSSYREFIGIAELTIDSNTKMLEVTSNFVYYIVDYFKIPGRLIIVFYAAITYLFICLSASRYKVQLGYLLPLFILSTLFIHSFNLCRQVATVPIIAVAFSYIYESRFKSLLFFVLVLFATTIHFSSIVYIILYLLRWIKIDPKYFIGATLVISLFSILGLVSLEGVIDYVAFGQYADYYGDEISNRRVVSLLGSIATFIFLILQVIMLSKIKSRYIYVFAIACVLTTFMGGMQSYIMRIFLPISYFVSLLYATFMSTRENKTVFNTFVSVLTFSLLLYIYISSISGSKEMTPYYFDF